MFLCCDRRVTVHPPLSLLGLFNTHHRRTVELPPHHLTECIIEVVSECELPHEIAELLLTITNQNNKVTILWGS